jgi:pimeloyl-ACP methyl ester carboxylesterase
MTRHFVTVGDRQMHYRRAGSGPALLMLHISPLSSRTFEPVMNALARSFTVIAPDRPGYGHSDRLADPAPQIPDYAGALGAMLDALGIERVSVYARATGSIEALELARQNPGRINALILENLVMVGEEQRDALVDQFAPSFEAQWDGSHLLRAWCWWRDFMLFWPWFDRRAAARLEVAMAPAASLHEDVMDTLRAGPSYRLAPDAVFRYDPRPALAELTMPVTVMTAETPEESPGAAGEWLERLRRDLPAAHVRSYSIRPHLLGHQLPAATPTWLRYVEQLERLLANAAGSEPAPPAPPPAPTAPLPGGGLWRSFVATLHGAMHLRQGGASAGRPLLMLHALGRSGASLEPLARELGRERPLLVPDLPGFGESEAPRDRRVSAADYATPIGAVLDVLAVGEVDLYGTGFGALIAAELAARDPRIRRVVLDDLPPVDPDASPACGSEPSALAPHPDGTHLIHAWSQVRDGTLAQHREPRDPAVLQAQTMELLAGAAELLLASRMAPPAMDIDQLRTPILTLTPDPDADADTGELARAESIRTFLDAAGT